MADKLFSVFSTPSKKSTKFCPVQNISYAHCFQLCIGFSARLPKSLSYMHTGADLGVQQIVLKTVGSGSQSHRAHHLLACLPFSAVFCAHNLLGTEEPLRAMRDEAWRDHSTMRETLKTSLSICKQKGFHEYKDNIGFNPLMSLNFVLKIQIIHYTYNTMGTNP